MNKPLDAKHKSSYHAKYEQAAHRKARSNPLHALRGIVHAVYIPRGGRFHKYGFQASY